MPDHPWRVIILVIVAILVVLGLRWYQSGRLADDEAQALLSWLACEECSDNELGFIRDTLGSRASGPLREVLMDLPPEYMDAARRSLALSWSMRTSAVDSAAYFDHYLANYRATLQRRAAVGLTAIGDSAGLREALDRAPLLGYRPDVVDVIEAGLRALDAPDFQIAPGGESMRLRPTAVTVAVGNSALLGATTRDRDGNPVGGPITWSSSDSAVARVASPDRGVAVVRGVSPGAATVTADFGDASETAAVTVVLPGAVVPESTLVKVSGDAQIDVVGTPLDQPLVVRVTDPNGTELAGIDVDWIIVRGPGEGNRSTSPTGQNGEAMYRPTLGQAPGVLWIDAEAVGKRVRFRIRVRTP